MKQIATDKAPAAIGPYSQGLDLGNLVFVSGQIPVDPATGKMPEAVEEQAVQALTNLKNVLAAAGLGMECVVKTVVFLADLADFATVNRIYESFFKAPFPVRSCVQVAAIPKGAKLEIECIAAR
ncbi:MAG: RidA family protein [Ruminococcaceae bacterium]|nr:RidA family protein [Oscillospiraceae bacterium]